MKGKWSTRNKSAENQRLALLAKELGTATMIVLVNDYDFSRDEANEALAKILSQAKDNRELIVTNAVMAFYDAKNKGKE